MLDLVKMMNNVYVPGVLNENIVQNYLNIALLNVFSDLNGR